MKEVLKKYAPEDIYNADENGLFLQLLSDRTLQFKGENCCGEKKSKQRLATLLCANSTGTHKIQPKLFFPECTSILWPVDMALTKCFKGYYRRRFVNSILINIENKEEPFKAVNVKEAYDNNAGGKLRKNNS
ncbi:hypothetical protein AVEN_72643-1 [Araneus ventricosus]|uniref:DDE-1 domain-containing protein n=1 Tax=Araneus ventricosus TaxID=182803 RepID=A0A4Y1ZPV4_ARAVE|nr:hypothetical protein AVEN_229001-1 [Araneus ventricosus]GBL61199.1 hypothetical protein AVEN_72643-1 [Araneus ventricosus]